MAMNMDQMQMMMAQMHAQNYMNDMRLAQYFQAISSVYTTMAQGEYQMYQMHSGQTQGIGQMQGMGQMTTPMNPSSQTMIQGM